MGCILGRRAKAHAAVVSTAEDAEERQREGVGLELELEAAHADLSGRDRELKSAFVKLHNHAEQDNEIDGRQAAPWLAFSVLASVHRASELRLAALDTNSRCDVQATDSSWDETADPVFILQNAQLTLV